MFKVVASTLMILALASGCSSGADSSAQFREALSGLSAENDLHASGCSHADSASAMINEMGRHDAKMTELFDEMDSGFSVMMGHCRPSNAGAMQDLMSTMRADDGTHRSQMGAARTLAEGRTTCVSYTETTRQHLIEMNEMMGSGSMHCMM